MYKIVISIPDIRSRYKNLSVKARQQFRTELQTVVDPLLQQAVKEELGIEPGPVKKPFGFGTPASRRAFFATKGFGRGLGAPRTHLLSSNWFVRIKYQLTEYFISFYNARQDSRGKFYGNFVYPGPNQVPGHAETGWGEDFTAAVAKLQALARSLVIEAWHRAVRFAVRSKK